MTVAEAQAELTAVNAAILAIVTGKAQSYSINGRTVTRLDLNSLRELRKELEAVIARASSGTFLLARFRQAD